MIRIFAILLIAFYFNSGGSAKSLEKNIQFNWSNSTVYQGQSTYRMTFEEQTGVDDCGLPLVSFRYPVSDAINSIDDIKLSYDIVEEVALNAIEYSQLEELDPDMISVISKNLVTIRKEKFIEVTIVPIAFNEDLKAFVKVTKLKLGIEENANLSSNKLKAQLKSTTANNSVLNSGNWVRVSVDESGVHKIPYSILKSWGFSNPGSVKIFGNGGQMLPKLNSAERVDDLRENATWHFNDAIFFYAQGPTEWSYDKTKKMFIHQLNDYTDEACYFLTEDAGDGLTVVINEDVPASFNVETSEYDSYKYYEVELRNLIRSGKTWYGPEIYTGEPVDYNITFDNLVTDKPIKLLADVIGHSNSYSTMQVFVNDASSAALTMSIATVTYGDQTGSAAQIGSGQTSFYAQSGDLDLTLQYNTSSSSAFANLNYLCLNAREKIVLDDELNFRDYDLVGEGNVARYYFDGKTSNTILWDITDFTQPEQIEINRYDGRDGFTVSAEEPKEFVLFNSDASFPQPTKVEDVVNQDLHGADVPDMLIVTHPLFKEQAERLAQLHNLESGMQCLIVEPQEIYNEFSSGQPDVSAIRDFARYLYLKADNFKYLLLFGDGSYDNKGTDSDNTNFILTYQSENSINYANSYVSDDFYGFLDDNEGVTLQVDKLDIGIGRLPVGSVSVAEDVVEKIESYMLNQYYGSWKTALTFVGDDGDSNLHMRQADELTQKIESEHPEFNVNKIYFDAYKRTTTASGNRYLGVNEEIKRMLSEGTLLFNYTGHGSENQLAHENVLSSSDIQGLTNFDRLPVFITATCEFSRYDDKTLEGGSAGEHVLTTANGGGVALFTTTRIAWSNSNFNINSNLYDYIFERDDDGSKLRLGEIIQHTKNASSNTINKLNFTLLGDPALLLNYPTNKIYLDNINGEADESQQDTLKALTLIELGGRIEDGVSHVFENGTVDISVFDKAVQVSTLGNGDADPFEYEVYQNRIFNGEVSVEKDSFTVSFMVPQDIRYNVGKGKVSFYGSDNNLVEAFGANNEINVGNISDSPVDDEVGPEVTLWLNNSSFQDGDVVSASPVLYAQFADISGINASGIGIGHDLTLTLNDDRANAIVVNDYYSAKKNDYQQGALTYQLSSMEVGSHVLQLKVWDNQNNSTTVDLNFKVEVSGDLKIEETLIYPNPVRQGEMLTISFNHDAPNSTLESNIRLFDFSGRLIDEAKLSLSSVGGAVSPFNYELPTNLNRGLYILLGEFTSEEGQQGRLSEKIMVVK